MALTKAGSTFDTGRANFAFGNAVWEQDLFLALLDGGFCHGIDNEVEPAVSDVSSGSSDLS